MYYYSDFHYQAGNFFFRLGYFTAESTNKKSDFMKCLNASYKIWCLQCSFSDKELAEYVQFKKRQMNNLSKMYGVHRPGQQENGTWVLNSYTHLSQDGTLIDPDSHCYVWLGELYCGSGIAPTNEACNIRMPLSLAPLSRLVNWLKLNMHHNFMSSIITVAATVLALHYKLFLNHLRSCPVPLAFGESGTGKTTVILCGLSLLGAHDSRFYGKLTIEKILDLCSSSCIPLGVDDPQSKNDISRLLIDLFNGARSATITRGERKPSSTCIISANFTSHDQQRYSTDCL